MLVWREAIWNDLTDIQYVPEFISEEWIRSLPDDDLSRSVSPINQVVVPTLVFRTDDYDPRPEVEILFPNR